MEDDSRKRGNERRETDEESGGSSLPDESLVQTRYEEIEHTRIDLLRR